MKAGDLNMKFLDYMFNLEKWQTRPSNRAIPASLPDNKLSLAMKNPV